MKTFIKILHWLPRIICILAILVVSMFALDSFAPELTFWQQIGGFLMHLIPSFVLLSILIIFARLNYNFQFEIYEESIFINFNSF